MFCLREKDDIPDELHGYESPLVIHPSITTPILYVRLSLDVERPRGARKLKTLKENAKINSVKSSLSLG
jgi:hypothetical protein